MLSLSFTDDEMMSEQGIRSLHRLYANAPIEYRRIAPRDVGAPRIGHFGFFRSQFESTLWPLVPQWLRALQDPADHGIPRNRPGGRSLGQK
jgi:predicted alpha/beta hydrolase